MDMTIPAATVQKLNSLSDNEKLLVVNLIDRLDRDKNGRVKHGIPDIIGLFSLKLVDWFGPKSELSDEEVDAYISSVRAERRADRN